MRIFGIAFKFKLLFADVTFERASRCPTSGSTVTTSSTTTVIPSSTPSLEVIRTCMLNCPTTSEYNPICGSNGVTYDNPSRFECAKMCGLNIQMLRRSRCEVTGSSVTPNTNTTPNSTSATTPTSISISSPITNATPIPTKPNVTPITPNVTPTSPKVAPTTPNGLDFTIPQDILDSIFTTDYGGLIDERHERRV
ncbi:unnamed protein product [Diatraea saccharalis]|uniref:Kazal-like domain-containing protein n=1 Tax=Diatraea saccharalis TaxID=40085 RepID=A0A9N9WCW6_9NEOP|nr:unnamed protein product [Diatraea saccharalis]